jgi:ribosomal-protein-alanine N-acetyltransferase
VKVGQRLRLETERLDIVAFSRELLGALDDPVAAARLIGASIPEGWPDEELSELLRSDARWVVEDSPKPGYGPWAVIARAESWVVGSAGFSGPPERGAIELGFGIHSDFRNRGYAAEAARALIEWGQAQPSVERIIAKCDPGNAASIRVLEKIGMINVDEQDGMLRWTSGRGFGPA